MQILTPQSVGIGRYEFSIAAPEAANLANPLITLVSKLTDTTLDEDIAAYYGNDEPHNVVVVADGFVEAEGEFTLAPSTSTRYLLGPIDESSVDASIGGECIVVTVDTLPAIAVDCTLNQPNTFTLHLHEGNTVDSRGQFVLDATPFLSPDGDSALGYIFATQTQVDQVRGNGVYVDSDAQGYVTTIGGAADPCQAAATRSDVREGTAIVCLGDSTPTGKRRFEINVETFFNDTISTVCQLSRDQAIVTLRRIDDSGTERQMELLVTMASSGSWSTFFAVVIQADEFFEVGGIGTSVSVTDHSTGRQKNWALSSQLGNSVRDLEAFKNP